MNQFREELKCDIQSDDIDRIRKLVIKTVIKSIGDLEFEECDILCDSLYDIGIKGPLGNGLEKDGKLIELYQKLIRYSKVGDCRELALSSEILKTHKKTLEKLIYQTAIDIIKSDRHLGQQRNKKDINYVLNAAIYASDLAKYLGFDPRLAESLALLEANRDRISKEELGQVERIKEQYNDINKIVSFALKVNENGFRTPEDIQKEGLDVQFAEIIINSRLDTENKFAQKNATLLYIEEMAKFNVERRRQREKEQLVTGEL